MEEARREITLDELEEMKRTKSPMLSQIQVSGTVLVKDKDGNVKSTMEITSIDVQNPEEEKGEDNAVS